MKLLTGIKFSIFIFWLLLGFMMLSWSPYAFAATTVAESPLTTPASAKTMTEPSAAKTATPLKTSTSSSSKTSSASNEAVGQMVWVKGKVEAIGSNSQTRILHRRSPVYEHDTIMTGSGSGQIAFTDNSLVALREGTTFRISEYKFNPGSSGEDKYVVDVAKGGFRTITGLISKARPDAYAVRTPVATIGVRGTMFDINYSPTRGLAVKLDKGALFVANKAGIAELDVAKNHVYSVTAGLNVRPAVTTKPSPILKGQPTLTNTKGAPITAGGAVGVTKVSTPASVTKTGNNNNAGTNTNTGTTKTNGMEPIPKGTVKSVTGFCIN